MATLREYFNILMSRLLNVGTERILKVDKEDFTVTERVYVDFDMAAECVGYYIPHSPHVLCVCAALMDSLPDLALAYKKAIGIKSGFPNETGTSTSDVFFTGRVYFYTEDELTPYDVSSVEAYGRERKLLVVVRGPGFAEKMSALTKPRAFICHDSRDKGDIAGPLALELEKRMCRVWYDEFSLNVGDNLIESIEKGLRECRKVIVIISKHFLANKGWTKTEFEAVFSRELFEAKKVLLPVWVGVTHDEVYKYSPTLVNKFAVNWNEGLDKVVQKLYRAVTDDDCPSLTPE
ncbi:MAG: toll/interleukin-1 receptor domain-containing protein [Candidatus Hydrogenedentes bacterium]|nr:toll/interleukin-1 receptor domain-containing protein [Candidatus Hydrogenedentota bacterium]